MSDPEAPARNVSHMSGPFGFVGHANNKHISESYHSVLIPGKTFARINTSFIQHRL
jgi:hypothetical protein